MSDHSSQAGPDLMGTISNIVGLPAHLQPNPAPHEQSGVFPDYAFTESKRQFGGPDPEPEATPERIDHAAEARTILREVDNGDGNLPEDWCGASDDEQWLVRGSLAEAQVHATLALVDEQRTANLIAYVAKWTDDEVLDVDALIRQRLGLL